MEEIGSKFQNWWSLVPARKSARTPRNTLRSLKKPALRRKTLRGLKKALLLVKRKAPPITPTFFRKCTSSSKIVPNSPWKWQNLNSGTTWSAQGKKILRRLTPYLQRSWKYPSPRMTSKRKSEPFHPLQIQTPDLFFLFSKPFFAS